MHKTSKVVLLTGASGGLGTAIARHLSQKNYKVYGTSRKERVSQYYTWVPMDLSDAASIDKAINSVLSKENRIDILINNAGIGITGSIEETPIDDLRKVFEVNFFGMVQTIQKVVPVMRGQQSGTIINISSIAGYTGLPFRGFYSATKSAVMRMSEALSSEVQQFNIKVIDVAPGDFKTNIAAGRLYTEAREDSPYYADYKRILKMIDDEVDAGLEPDILGRKVDKILQTKHPKLRYNIGLFMQRLTPYLTCLLSGRFFEKLILKHYKMRK